MVGEDGILERRRRGDGAVGTKWDQSKKRIEICRMGIGHYWLAQCLHRLSF